MKPQETMGPAVKDRAVRELKKVGKDLQDIHLQVKQQQKENQGLEEWIQVGFFIIDHLLFGLYILFFLVSFITIIIIWVNSYFIL